jgi:hypothetical protein
MLAFRASLPPCGALRVASKTYQYLLRNGMQRYDPSEAAMALNRAVSSLREDSDEVTLDRWTPFIHFGI